MNMCALISYFVFVFKFNGTFQVTDISDVFLFVFFHYMQKATQMDVKAICTCTFVKMHPVVYKELIIIDNIIISYLISHHK